jgi:hypothetical protein
MNFIEICDVFGGSILPDEYRGSFEDADRYISGLEQEVIARPSSTIQKARATLLRAIYYTLSGDFAEAREHVQNLIALQHQGLDRIWMLRGQMYEFYAAMLQHRPPGIRFALFPGDPYEQLREDDSDLKALHIQARTAGRAICAIQSTTFVEKIEQALILDIWSYLETIYLSYLVHPNFTPHVTAESLPQGKERNLSFQNFPVPYLSSTLASDLRNSGISTFQNLLQRMTNDVEWAKGGLKEDPAFTRLEAEYENANDYAGMGLSKINEGDRILSPSYTSPIAFNLICEIRDNGWANMAWDTFQPTFPLKDNDGAQRCYTAALFYMEAACAPRGQAAVYLRRGCVNHAEGVRSHAGPDSAHFVQSGKDFSTALSLFAKDNVNRSLTICHLALLNCSRGRHELAVDRARRLGAELRKARSPKLSHFLGALMLRFAHFQFSQHKNTTIAATCCNCAAVYYQELDSPLGSFFTAEAFITLFKRTHNWTLAEAKVRDSISRSGTVQGAFAYIDSILSRRVGLRHLQGPRAPLLLEFDTLVKSVCSMTGNEDLRSQWEEVRRGLQPMIPPRIPPRSPTNIMGFAPLNEEARRHLNDPLFGCGESEMAYFMQTYETRNEFIASYFQSVDRSFEAIGRGDMEAADAQLEAFVSSCNSQKTLRVRDVLDHKIPTLAQLGRTDEMRHALPQFISDWFITDGLEDIRRVCDRRGVPSDIREHAIQQRRNIAQQDISMCFMAQAWDKGLAILVNIATVLPDFFDKLRTEPKPDTWQLLTFIGAFYERDSKL